MYLIISAVLLFVAIVGVLAKGRIDLALGAIVRSSIPPPSDAVGPHEVIHRGTFGEELGVHADTEI